MKHIPEHGWHTPPGPPTNVVDALGGLDVPPANPQYRVRYVSLPDDEYRGYYYGFANEGLWPLCHAGSVTLSINEGPRHTLGADGEVAELEATPDNIDDLRAGAATSRQHR